MGYNKAVSRFAMLATMCMAKPFSLDVDETQSIDTGSVIIEIETRDLTVES